MTLLLFATIFTECSLRHIGLFPAMDLGADERNPLADLLFETLSK